MKVGIVRATWTACVALASIALVVGFALNQRSIGLGFAIGLVVGAGNGQLIQRVVERRAPFVISSVVRIAAVSLVAILTAVLLRASPVAVFLGVAAAQFVMVATALREGLRA